MSRILGIVFYCVGLQFMSVLTLCQNFAVLMRFAVILTCLSFLLQKLLQLFTFTGHIICQYIHTNNYHNIWSAAMAES